MSKPQDPKTSEAKSIEARAVSDPRICLGVLAYGGLVHGKWMESVEQSLAALKVGINGQQVPLIGWTPKILGDSLVCRARNNIAHLFLSGRIEAEGGEYIARQFEWLLFIDTDIVFEPAMIGRLYKHAVEHKKRVVCGMYPIKKLKPRFVLNALPGCVPDETGMVKVLDAGTGFMLIHRSVFIDMIHAFGSEMQFIADDDDLGQNNLRYDFFAVGPRYDRTRKRIRYLSEDYYFTQRCYDLNIDVWIDTKVQARHIGQVEFPVSLEEYESAAEAYRKLRASREQAAVDEGQNSNADDSGARIPVGFAGVDLCADHRAQADTSDISRSECVSPPGATDPTAPDVGGGNGCGDRL